MKYLKTVFKFAFVAGLLWVLVRKGFISVDATARAFSRVDLLFPAVLLLFCTTFVGIYRWQLLLRAQGLNLRFARVLQLAFVGNFFNIALPGAVSGDFVKAYYIAREVEGHRARAFGSILFDRVAGLSALSILAAGALLMGRHEIAGSGFFPAIRILVLLPGLAFVAFYAYLFVVREHHDPVLILLKNFENRFAKLGAIVRIYQSLRHYHHHRSVVLKVLGLSLLIHSFVCVSMLLFLTALGETQFVPIGVFIGAPIGLLFTAIPIAPAGVGTGHAAFGWLFHYIGTARGADVFSLFAATQLLIGMIGGLVYLRFRAREAPIPEAVADGA